MNSREDVVKGSILQKISTVFYACYLFIDALFFQVKDVTLIKCLITDQLRFLICIGSGDCVHCVFRDHFVYRIVCPVVDIIYSFIDHLFGCLFINDIRCLFCPAYPAPVFQNIQRIIFNAGQSAYRQSQEVIVKISVKQILFLFP